MLTQPAFRTRRRLTIAAGILGSLVVPWSLVHASKSVQQRVAADQQGTVEIVSVAGNVDISGWDRPEVEVTGTVGDQVDHVDLNAANGRVTVHVVASSGSEFGDKTVARLQVHVPARSTVVARLVSADLKLSGVTGEVKLQTVSGDINGDVGGDLSATTVSGDVKLTARNARSIDIRSASGDIKLTGGGGNVDVNSVSGDIALELGNVNRGRLKTVSGALAATLTLAPDAQLEGQSVSGDLSFEFTSAPAGDFDIQTFSGDIDNCFGPKPVESRYGPGTRLTFKNGEGRARVSAETKSGDVRLCVLGQRRGYVRPDSAPQFAAEPVRVVYVF
jgi:Putative adhesin